MELELSSSHSGAIHVCYDSATSISTIVISHIIQNSVIHLSFPVTKGTMAKFTINASKFTMVSW